MPKDRVTTQQRRAVAARANGNCEYCRSQARFTTQSFSVEHILPRSLGGETILDNLALACSGCNEHKHTKISGHDPMSSESVSLYHPRNQKWSEHFRWSDDFTLIIGLTPTGRATVGALHLNRDGLINLRQVLYAMGQHPPLDNEDIG